MKLIQIPSIVLNKKIASLIIHILALPLLTGGMLSQTAWTPQVLAQKRSLTQFRLPPPPPGRNAPGNRGGGAGRNCGIVNQSVMALMPAYHQSLPEGGQITKVWGTTLSDRPTFWFDIPYEKATIASIEFVLQDNRNPANDIYRTAVTPPQTPGIISIALPQTVPPLKVGKLYQWFFKVRWQCPSTTVGISTQVTKEQLFGWVERIQPGAGVIDRLKQSTPQQKFDLYAENGIWFDAVTTLAQLRLENPQDRLTTENWNELLRTADLEKITAKSLTSCCKPGTEKNSR